MKQIKKHKKHGDIAQLGEHLPCKQGVKGSIPFISMPISAYAVRHLSNRKV